MTNKLTSSSSSEGERMNDGPMSGRIICGKCGKKGKENICPYDRDINHRIHECTCCEACYENCLMDI